MCFFQLSRNYWVLINTFSIYLRFVKYRFVRNRFVRYWFRFVSRPWLETDIPSKYFVCLQDVLKTSSRLVFETSSRHVFKTSLRRLQRNNFLSSKTSSKHLQDVFKTYLQDVYKTSWKTRSCYAEDALKTNKCYLGYF